MASPSDLAVFSQIVRAGSLSAAARELNVTTPAVSKRLKQIEVRLGVTLLARSTRRISLTVEGETYLAHARRILADIEDAEQQVSQSAAVPKGLLRVNATLGFGRSHIGPLLSQFANQYLEVETQLVLSAEPVHFDDDAFDVCIRFGEPPDARVVAVRLAPNRRLLCAAPAYLVRHGAPKVPGDLARHRCIVLRQDHQAFGVWRFVPGKGRRGAAESVKVRGALSSNDGAIALQWALEGHGILMRAEWDIARHLRSGRLVQVLAHYDTPPADIHAVYPARHRHSARVQVFVEFLRRAFENTNPGSPVRRGAW
jgi:DNA-binding transcriptional LysR family regulator